MPCKLRVVDTATGETIHRVLSDIWKKVPLWDAVSGAFKMIELSQSDRAAPNLRADAFFQFMKPTVPRLRMPCHIHLLAGVQGKSFDILGSVISGCISLGLAMRPAGAATKLREHIASVLEATVIVVQGGAPPAPDAPSMLYRSCLLNTCLPGDSTRQLRRRIILESVLNSDWQDARPTWYAPLGEIDVRAWASQAAEALLPSPIEVFQRGRWLSSAETVREVLLVAACHGVLAPAVRGWVGAAAVSGNE